MNDSERAAPTVQPTTMLDARSRLVLSAAARLASTIEGGVLELGVAEGGSIARLAEALPDRELIAVDAFRGLEDFNEFDPPDRGDDYRADRERTSRALAAFTNVRLVVGHFPDPDVLEQIGDGPFALAHYDADLYEPAVSFFEFVWPRLTPGGVLLVDDYGAGHWSGVKRAFRDFFGRDPSLWSGRQALHIKAAE